MKFEKRKKRHLGAVDGLIWHYFNHNTNFTLRWHPRSSGISHWKGFPSTDGACIGWSKNRTWNTKLSLLKLSTVVPISLSHNLAKILFIYVKEIWSKVACLSLFRNHSLVAKTKEQTAKKWIHAGELLVTRAVLCQSKTWTRDTHPVPKRLYWRLLTPAGIHNHRRNKKVLLRDRKRHTARCVACPEGRGVEVGDEGYPCPARGTPALSGGKGKEGRGSEEGYPCPVQWGGWTNKLKTLPSLPRVWNRS